MTSLVFGKLKNYVVKIITILHLSGRASHGGKGHGGHTPGSNASQRSTRGGGYAPHGGEGGRGHVPSGGKGLSVASNSTAPAVKEEVEHSCASTVNEAEERLVAAVEEEDEM
jgi:hypothetical protein